MAFRAVEVIARKRDNKPVTKAMIEGLVRGYVGGSVPDYQMAAFCMAVVWRGMSADETAWLLDAMQASGEVLDWSDLPMPTADKHSTGGVGDKVSLPLAPAVAACGVAVPMISGRGLGHTGGTLDKLESIPGPGINAATDAERHFTVRFSLDGLKRLVHEVGVAMIGQTETLVPADRKMYSLRDVTATVESIPLIVASIMSKKLAEGAASLVLDVKVGSGAFMKNVDDARALARAMVDAGQRCGRKVTAFLTAMERPLGTHIGNALEVVESIELLRGEGPADSRALVCRLGGEMLRLAGVADSLAHGESRIAGVLDDGTALGVFEKMLIAQGGDPRVATDLSLLPSAPVVRPFTASSSGVMASMDALEVGLAAVRLGAGRNRVTDPVDPAVGFVLHRKPGDEIAAGDRLVTIHARDEAGAAAAAASLRGAITIAEKGSAPDVPPLFIDTIH